MVIAGPGTGKTQILAARIGYILSRKDLQTFPENILCMTYTEAGTVAMRQRLLAFIGPDAYRINIATFHGFCNQLIRQYPEYFGHDSWQMISEIEEVQLVREIIDGLQAEHPLKKFTGDAYSDAGRLLQLFRQIRQIR
jgi:DNA helicase-2/ATP-dependent DNA helicase PcrA